jgi:glycosyltransferase involved in cell wall biosynthesis
MTRCVFAIPGSLATPNGGYAYARKILPLLAGRMEMQICRLPDSFPVLSDAERRQAREAIAAWDRPGTVFLIDSLAFAALPAPFLASVTSPIAALAHHPLALEQGLSSADKARLLRLEGEALACCKAIAVPSAATAGELTSLFGVPAGKIVIAEPGILRGRRAAGSAAGEPLHIVSVGTLTPRKGFAVLAQALGLLRALPWRWTIAGALDLSPQTVAEVRAKISACGLGHRVHFAGQLDEASVSALYSSGDIFALASYYEGFGMAFAEAIAHGLPIVASGDGAVADTVPPAAGFVCAAGAVSDIAEALQALLCDEPLRRAKAGAAWQHGQTLPDWPGTAATIAGLLERLSLA